MKKVMSQKELEKYIPLDKSWIIRMGFLDTISGSDNIVKFLDNQKVLNDDLKALLRVAKSWLKGEKVLDVGESGTIYRLFKFASWKLDLKKEFIKSGTLKERNICNDSSIINLSIENLLKIDNNTSQFATASLLISSLQKNTIPELDIKYIPFKLQVTIDAISAWQEAKLNKLVWKERYDETIKNQAECFLKMINGESDINFIPEQAEDYCFARIFNYITKEEGESKWPALRGHESDRIEEMEKVIGLIKDGKSIDSRDHRVVQAAGFYKKINKSNFNILYPEAVNKTWPLFWEFLESIY